MASLQLAPAAVHQVSYASLSRRVAAHLIDVLIALAVMLAGGLFMRWLRVLGVWSEPSFPGHETAPAALWRTMSVAARLAIVVAFVVSMGPFYSGLFQASAWQATVGKRLVKIFVTDTAGRRLGLLRSLARSFAKIGFNISYLGVVSIGTIIGAQKKQALHDFVAKTVVLNGRPLESGSPELWRIVAAFGIQFAWFVVTMLEVMRTFN